MTPSARLSAAIEVLARMDADRIPVALALKEWGLAHRFAGSGDRSAISGLVYDVLRRNASSAWLLDSDTARARLIGMLRRERGMSTDAIARLCDGGRFAPSPLSAMERAALDGRDVSMAPAHVAGDYPEWLAPSFSALFGGAAVVEGEALASRAPLDLRVNLLKAAQDEVLASLAHLGAVPTPWSPWGLRIALSADARSPAIHAETDFIKGRVEVQDEGSQLASLFAAARPGETVIDLCAGAGGKTLALAAAMNGKGRLVATDRDKRQLAPIHERLTRAGARNVEVRPPRGEDDPLGDLSGAADLVLVDAPCTGTGTWRRNPDAKWRMRPGALEIRLRDQVAALDRAADLVRPGGRLAYVTCSILPQENGEQVRAFAARHPEFAVMSPDEVAGALGERAGAFTAAAMVSAEGLLLTPRRTGTDGFFVSVLRHAA